MGREDPLEKETATLKGQYCILRFLKNYQQYMFLLKIRTVKKNYKLKKNTAPIHQPAGPLIKISKVKESQRVGCY